MYGNGLVKNTVIFFLFFVVLFLIWCPLASSQTWQALPPYDFLWPLWSRALSPTDPVTGLPTPVVSELYSSTVLPIQPGIAWNPIFDYPYLLYNAPLGLQYYDPLYGINPWPPSYVLDPVSGGPISISPPVGYAFLPPTDSAWIQTNVPIANLAFLAEYPALALAAYTSGLPYNLSGVDPWLASLIYPTPAFSSLLTPAQILGYAPVAVAPAVVAPVPIAPVPTPIAPVPTPVAPAPAPVAPLPLSVLFPPATALVPPLPAPQPVVPPPTAAFPPPAATVAPPAPTAIVPPVAPTVFTTTLPPGSNIIILL